MFDCMHYIETSYELSRAILLFFGAKQAPAEHFGNMLMLDGFGVPLTGSIAFIFLGRQETYILALLFIQTLVHAATTIFVFLCAKKIDLSILQSAVCAVAYALYPPAVVASGTFLSEPLGALLLIIFAWSAISISKSPENKHWFTIAATTELIAISRTAMLVPCALVLLFLAIIISKRGIKKSAIASALIGFTLPFLPWLYLTKTYYGSIQLLPERVPSINLAIGCDTTIGGWETMPIPPTTMKYFWEKPLRILAYSWHDQPVQLFALSINKLGRLWTCCFNDFHDSVIGLNYDTQLIWHRILIGAALASLLYIFVSYKKQNNRTVIIPALLILGHCAFLPFEAIPRYTFTSMPSVILLAFYCFSLMLSKSAKFKTMACTVISVFLGLGYLYDRTQQFGHTQFLDKNTYAERTIFPNTNIENTAIQHPAWVAALVDISNQEGDITVSLNGTKPISVLKELRNIESGFQYQSTINEIEDIICRARNVPSKDLHQWYIAEFPMSAFDTVNPNTIRLAANQGSCNIGVQPITSTNLSTFSLPALRYFSVTKCFNSADGLEGRIKDSEILRNTNAKCNYLNDSQEYRLYLLVAPYRPKQINAETGHKDSPIQIL